MTTHITSISETAQRSVAPISSITVIANKPLELIKLSIGEKKFKHVHWERSSEQELSARFNPSVELFESRCVTLRLHYRERSFLRKKVQRIDIGSSELVGHDHEWKKSHDGADITIHFLSEDIADHTTMTLTTDEIIKICPRFRVLVIGKSGVGKSSVINAAFHTTEANVAHGTAGVSDINIEIIPPKNNYFVLHDSQGFEHGEEENFAIVKNFIETRSSMPDVKDKIHAIWLCFGIPRAGGRILETGIEEFFQMKTRTPIIAVFTKYDLLMSRFERSRRSTGVDAETQADAFIKKACVEHLEKAAGMKIPNMAVSTQKGFEFSVSELVRLTQTLVEKNFPMEPSVVAAIAQRVNPSVKIEGCIVVGQKKYWKILLSSASITENSLEPCLDVTHGDIVVVWNLDDPRMHLRCKEFKALITNLVDNIGPNTATDPKKTISAGLAIVGAIAGIVSALAGPAAPIVIPIAGCCVLAKWVHDVYQQSHDILRRLMAYIVDLTLIMQNVFWLVAIHRVPVSRRLVKVAYVAYKDSTVMPRVHEEIKEYVKKQTVLDRLHRDNALEKIEELLNRYCINTAEMFRLEEGIRAIDFSERDDESWVVTM